VSRVGAHVAPSISAPPRATRRTSERGPEPTTRGSRAARNQGNEAARRVLESNGRFVLTGLPAGRVEVRFEGPGLDARVEITGLVDGQTLTITFHASGGRVQVVSPGEEAEIEIKGPVESVTPPTLRVQGRTIQTDANTRIRGPREELITLGQLRRSEERRVGKEWRSRGSP